MIGAGRYKITSSYGTQDYLLIRVGRQDTLDDIMDLCLRNMPQKHINKALLIIEQNDSRDTVEYMAISLDYYTDGGKLEYTAFGETEDGTKVILVPVVLGDNGIEFVGAEFIVEEDMLTKVH